MLSLPVYADPLDQNTGNPERFVKPPAITFPAVDTIPQCSIASGYLALSLLPANSPAAYCDIAMGYRVMTGKMTSAAINNIGMGDYACKLITTGANNICLGSGGSSANAGPGSSLTTGSRNISIGAESGFGYGTSNDNIIFEFEGVGSGNAGNNNILIDGHGGWSGSNSVLLGLDTAYNSLFNGQFDLIVGLNAGRNNVDAGASENNIILIGGSQNTAPNTHDVATTTSNNALSIGGGTTFGVGGNHPGTFDTAVGLNALHLNAQDNAKQTAFGYTSLQNSNVANAQNTAFGYQTGKLLTTGTNNALLGYNVGSVTLTTGSNDIIIGSGLTSLASGTSNEINIGGLLFYNNSSTGTPVVSSCGTGSPSIDSKANDKSGTVTAGTIATTCTITFASANATFTHCRVFSEGVTGLGYTYTNSAITVTASVLGGGKFDYDCDGV